VTELMPSMSSGYYHKGFALHQLHDYTGAVSGTGCMSSETRFSAGGM
jgi:hypothetical protein